MPLRSLAFGPLPKAQVQASQRIGQAAPSGGPRLSGLGGGGGGDYDAALTVGGPQREPEAFSPVFPDLYAANQGGGDVMDLPGAGGEPDFTSDTAQALANPPRGTGVSPQASNLPESWRMDLDTAFKALKGLNTGVKAVEGPQRPPGGSGSAPMVNTGSLQGLAGEIGAGGAPPSDIFDPGAMGGGLPSSGGGGNFSVGGGLGALNSLYGLGTSAASGNPLGIAQGALNSYGALTGLSGVSPISSSLVSMAPEVAAAIAESAGIATAGMSATQLTSAVSGALAAWGGAAAPIIQGIVEYVNNAEQMRMRDAGWRNNPIKGALYSNATAGVGQATKLFDSLGSDLTGANTQDLLGALIGGTNSLMPYYATAPGGRGPIRASDTVTGKKQGPTSSGVGYTGDGASPAQYTGNFTNAQDKLVAAVNELMRRGATYEELGQLPVSGDWAMSSLDASDPLQDLYNANIGKYSTEANTLAANAARETGTDWESWAGATPIDTALFSGAQGAAKDAPDSVTKASGLVTSMYGGPLWAAIARMGAGGPQLQDLIKQNFDPWATARQMSPAGITQIMNEQIQRARLASDPGTPSPGGL